MTYREREKKILFIITIMMMICLVWMEIVDWHIRCIEYKRDNRHFEWSHRSKWPVHSLWKSILIYFDDEIERMDTYTNTTTKQAPTIALSLYPYANWFHFFFIFNAEILYVYNESTKRHIYYIYFIRECTLNPMFDWFKIYRNWRGRNKPMH